MIAERLERRDRLVHAAHVELFLKILLGPRHVARASLLSSALALGFGLRLLIGVVVDVLVDGVVEVLGFHQLAPNQLVGRDRLNVELDVVLREPRAQRFEIVGEIVEDAQVRSQRIHRDARVRRERAQVLHHLRLHRHLIFGQRVERVDDDRRDVARRPGKYSDRLVKMPGAIGSRCRLDGARSEREPSNLKNATGCGLPFCTIVISFWLRSVTGWPSLIGRDNRELDQRRSGTENRRRFLRRPKCDSRLR